MTVVDASVWVSAFMHDEPNHAVSLRWLSSHSAAGGRIDCPASFLPEVAGAIARRAGSPGPALAAVAAISRVPGLAVHDIDRRLADESAAVAGDLGLRGPDALYVALALATGAELVTWDGEQLRRAAGVVRTATPS